MGKKKPLKEVMRENKRMISRAIRELDREKQGLEREEQRLTMEIKKAARANQMQSVKIMAKVWTFSSPRTAKMCFSLLPFFTSHLALIVCFHETNSIVFFIFALRDT